MRRRALAPRRLLPRCPRPPRSDLFFQALCGDRGVGGLDQRALGYGADDLFLHLATLDDEQVWNAADSVAAGRLRIVVNIHFHNFESAGVLAREVVDDRRDRAAWRAPRRPKIDQDRSRGFENFLVEARVGNMNDFIAGHRKFSPETQSYVET